MMRWFAPDAFRLRVSKCDICSKEMAHGLRAAEDWGREQGAELASLEYLAANMRAASFYERTGYRVAAITAIKRL